VLSILKVLVLPAKLNADHFGDIVLAVSFTTFFGIFISLGTSPYMVRAVARDHSLVDNYLSNALALRLAMAVAVFTLMMGIANLLGYPAETLQIFFIVGLQMVLFTISNVFESGLQALGQMSWKAIAVAVAQSSTIILGVTLLLMGANYVTYAWTLPLGMALQLALVLSYYLRRHPIKWSFDRGVMKALLVGGMPLFIWGFLQTAYGQIDATVLSLMTSTQNSEVVGWFGAAGQITNVLVAIPAAISAVAMPILCAMYVRSESDFNRTSIRTLVTTLFILMPVGVGLAISSADVIRFLPYKPEYINAAAALSFMALAVPMTGLLMVLATMAVAIGQEKQWVKISAFAVCIFPPLYIGLIWFFQNNPSLGNGATGAAMANLIGETALVIWAWFVLPHELRHKEVVQKGLQIGALTLIMAVVVVVLQRLGVWLFAYIAAGGLVYVAGAWVLKLVTPSDLQVVRNTLRRRRRQAPAASEL
jgi:O-antigen/teichoic acid export membrane protein